MKATQGQPLASTFLCTHLGSQPLRPFVASLVHIDFCVLCYLGNDGMKRWVCVQYAYSLFLKSVLHNYGLAVMFSVIHVYHVWVVVVVCSLFILFIPSLFSLLPSVSCAGMIESVDTKPKGSGLRVTPAEVPSTHIWLLTTSCKSSSIEYSVPFQDPKILNWSGIHLHKYNYVNKNNKNEY